MTDQFGGHDDELTVAGCFAGADGAECATYFKRRAAGNTVDDGDERDEFNNLTS